MSMVQDQDLARKFVLGNEDALRAIHDTYSARMLAVAVRMLADRELAADAVQQAFLQAWQARSRFDPEKPIEPWLFAITRRTSIDVYRKNADRSRFVSLDGEWASYVDHPVTESSEDAAIKHWLTWQVRAAVEKLSASDQLVVRLTFLEDRPHQEVADLLRIPIGTVKSRLFRAQRKLATILSDRRQVGQA
ncbi:sigma-70 family RNA polymerase sigma factor [Catellatospora sp. NPDC049609]|uniref:RNA polymerase sigma factor n=1 Tax=Catellatospora sp. NPDC049609 TaxID=3155505 RepID=UPI00342231D6